ncbi:uncharacterized protein BJ212DRAFT_1487094 [Suillus subaureus]|uniref:Uncharacterized protein n=1 Tax=Suillus subaureus TaxID=48587 RepID=A0A9P7J564_9AGAM|nr:uncharacterized protein BJ212DRAFT_1487094 [Suillus subaureus]KAG1803229.1 hypothetical protein BJ212DRAFT_1487094 [Suillus subaureus]
MKTGQQVKAEAVNIFNAVLTSVTKCEKLMCSLQEVEAYSKLYYQRHVKSMVDNELKAEAEVLQTKNEALTNGMHVAIVNKETGNLYEAETDKVKAEVWRYIEDAKMHRDNEKEVMWSKDDYGRKLAAMVNKFLMGLADATGFSFSLLVGGPSPELCGLIDVYSFHICKMKYGNDFSKAYLEFESTIMSPFRDYLHQNPTQFTNLSIAEATAALKARLGDGGRLTLIGIGLPDDTSDQVIFSLSDILSHADKVTDINFEGLTDMSWPVDNSFWEGHSTQINAFEASGGNLDLPYLPPYSQAASALESLSPPITLPPVFKPLPLPVPQAACSSQSYPANMFAKVSALLPNIS